MQTERTKMTKVKSALGGLAIGLMSLTFTAHSADALDITIDTPVGTVHETDHHDGRQERISKLENELDMLRHNIERERMREREIEHELERLRHHDR
ncbi:MAG: hypothetical protein HQL03_08670 [Nitrospirae bacterium]|nr:hypothetical protein [Nitrospirota bacterium]MBF0592636.1 hypothetical protein [Nitrospirota bacterium]